jgi:Leucine-rich repeat (LRR) protein
LRIRVSNSTFSKKKLKFAILFIVLVITLPIGIIYLSAKARDLRDLKQDEKNGKYEILTRALKNKENVRYLRLYKYPDSYTSIPKGVFELYNLEELELYSNEIELIPADISSLKKLKILDLQYNQIQLIPDEVGLLSGLEKLVLMNNSIDSINPKICNCLNLKQLYVGGKSLKSIPNCLSQMPRLEKLVVQSDSINNFMEDFKKFKNLKELTLYTYGNSIRDNKKYLELEKVLPNTKMDIPSSLKNK